MSIRAFLPTHDEALVALSTGDDPSPAPHETVVAVEAFSPNRGEILRLAAGQTEPPGKDIAGRVVHAAADGSGPAVGTRVVAHPEVGGWAERVAVPTDRVVALSDTLDVTQAAALPLAGLTALRLLRASDPAPGRRVLMTGASGGVGHYFVELAKAAGVAVTAVSRRGEQLLALGADRVVADVADAEGPFDVVIDSVGGESFQAALLQLRSGGLMLWYGQAGGEPARADFFAFMGGPHDITIRHFLYWTQGERDHEDLTELVDLVARGALHPEIGRVEDWEHTPAVLAAIRDRTIRGNAVLTIPTSG